MRGAAGAHKNCGCLAFVVALDQLGVFYLVKQNTGMTKVPF